MEKAITAVVAKMLILAGNWKDGHTLFSLDEEKPKEILNFGGIEEKEGKKTRKLSPDELFAKIEEEVKIPLAGAKIFIVMFQPNIIISSFFICRGARIFGIASFQGKCKGVDGQLELVVNTLKSGGGESKFTELTASWLGTSSIAALRNSVDELTRDRIRINNRTWINQAVLQSMRTLGMDKLTEKRLRNKIDEVNSQISEVVALSENETKAQLEKLLVLDPVYKQVLEPIYQIGPSLAAKLMKEIMTIERFATKEKLVAYFGLHVVNGKAPRRKKAAKGEKKEAANWNTDGKTALYLWAEQLMKGKNKRPDDPYVQRLLHYYAIYIAEYEANGGKGKIENKKHAFFCAYRQVAKKLLHHIYREWKRVEGESSVVVANIVELSA